MRLNWKNERCAKPAMKWIVFVKTIYLRLSSLHFLEKFQIPSVSLSRDDYIVINRNGTTKRHLTAFSQRRGVWDWVWVCCNVTLCATGTARAPIRSATMHQIPYCPYSISNLLSPLTEGHSCTDGLITTKIHKRLFEGGHSRALRRISLGYTAKLISVASCLN